MRLKVFFAPFAFLIVIIVSIWYIWPAVGDVIVKVKELKTSKNNLSTAAEKKNSLENMKADLDKNKEKEDFILSFLPYSESEEKIVDGINYLAADSGLGLINISLQDEKEDSALASSANGPSAGSAPGDMNAAPPVSKVKNVTAKVVLSGKYENIKLFLGQIYKMQMFNKINSMVIAKQDSNFQPGQPEGPSDLLNAIVEINYGYMPLVHAQLNENSADSLNGLDFSLYSKLKDSISEKIPVLDGGEKGKTNPFIP